jgi:glucose-1-phosphatase
VGAWFDSKWAHQQKPRISGVFSLNRWTMPIDLNKYKNIIFDFGGVIINIDYNLTARAFQDMGLSDFDEMFSKAKQRQLFDLYEKGQITTLEFRTELRSAFNIKPTPVLIDKAWNAMLLDLPRERIDLLERLKSTHRTFLLSNTNEMHIDTIYNSLRKDMGIPDFSVYFEKVYLSYKVKMRKPDSEIFKMVMNDNRLKAQETLFIDDSPQHIEAAKRLGIQTYLLDVTKESILDVFSY